MTKNKLLTVLLAVILLIVLFTVIKYSTTENKSAVSPEVRSMIPSVEPVSAPKTFKFDKSTDLKKELDSINPQVLDSDFN